MAYKTLGQAKPAATTETDLYEVPAGYEAAISSLVVCNQDGSTADTYRVSVGPGGASTDDTQFTHYDVSLAANTTAVIKAGFTMTAGDVLRVYATNGTLSFSLFGIEKPL